MVLVGGIGHGGRCRKWSANFSSVLILEGDWTYTGKVAGRIALSECRASYYAVGGWSVYYFLGETILEWPSDIRDCRIRAVFYFPTLYDAGARTISTSIRLFVGRRYSMCLRGASWTVEFFNIHDHISGNRRSLR